MRQIPAAIAIVPAPITNSGLLDKTPVAKVTEDANKRTAAVMQQSFHYELDFSNDRQ